MGGTRSRSFTRSTSGAWECVGGTWLPSHCSAGSASEEPLGHRGTSTRRLMKWIGLLRPSLISKEAQVDLRTEWLSSAAQLQPGGFPCDRSAVVDGDRQPPFATGINACRKRVEKRRVEITPGPLWCQLQGVYTAHNRAEALPDELSRQHRGILAPQREDGLPFELSEQPFSIGP